MLGTARALTAADEAVTDTYAYTAFGSRVASSESTANPYRYVGKLGYYAEAALDGYYLRRRYYQPGTGRFVSRDTARQAGVAHYAYAGSRPGAALDPSGAASIGWGIGIGAGGGVGYGGAGAIAITYLIDDLGNAGVCLTVMMTPFAIGFGWGGRSGGLGLQR
jgi:RHS repeat-associated protein